MKTLRVGTKLWLHANGRIYSLATSTAKASSGTSANNRQDLVAPFSCRVVKVFVEPKAALKEGDPVLVIEAMKMETTFFAPRSGIVRAVLVRAGDVVSGGTAFVEWEKP